MTLQQLHLRMRGQDLFGEKHSTDVNSFIPAAAGQPARRSRLAASRLNEALLSRRLDSVMKDTRVSLFITEYQHDNWAMKLAPYLNETIITYWN